MIDSQMEIEIANALKLLEQGELSDCKLICKNILLEKPEDFRANYLLGYSAHLQAQYGVAKKYLTKSCQIDPNNSDALNTLGCTLRQLGETLAAETSFAKALQLNYSNANSHINLAMLKLDNNESDIAMEYLFKALNLEVGNFKVYLGLAIAHRQKSIPSLALEYIDIALALDPNSAEALAEKRQIIELMNSKDSQIKFA